MLNRCQRKDHNRQAALRIYANQSIEGVFKRNVIVKSSRRFVSISTKHWDYWGGLWPLSENTNYTNCNHQIKLGEKTETLGRCPESGPGARED